jgi:hypothetical protein
MLFSFRHSKYREPMYRLIPVYGGINHYVTLGYMSFFDRLFHYGNMSFYVRLFFYYKDKTRTKGGRR